MIETLDLVTIKEKAVQCKLDTPFRREGETHYKPTSRTDFGHERTWGLKLRIVGFDINKNLIDAREFGTYLGLHKNSAVDNKHVVGVETVLSRYEDFPFVALHEFDTLEELKQNWELD